MGLSGKWQNALDSCSIHEWDSKTENEKRLQNLYDYYDYEAQYEWEEVEMKFIRWIYQQNHFLFVHFIRKNNKLNLLISCTLTLASMFCVQ